MEIINRKIIHIPNATAIAKLILNGGLNHSIAVIGIHCAQPIMTIAITIAVIPVLKLLLSIKR